MEVAAEATPVSAAREALPMLPIPGAIPPRLSRLHAQFIESVRSVSFPASGAG